MQSMVTHDTEIHRQHVRLRIPIGIEIEGERHQLDDWSVGGFGSMPVLPGRRAGERFPARLILPFEDFELTLAVECELVYALPDGSRCGGRFVGLSAGQLALFRFIVDAYLSGEVVAGADLLAVIGREHAGQTRVRSLYDTLAREETRGRRARRVLGLSVLALASIGLVLLAAFGAYERLFVVRTDRGVIEAPMFAVRAPVAGVVEAGNGGLLAPGDPVGRVRRPDGALSPLPSPCACVLDEWVVAPGGLVEVGGVVASLVSADQPLVVRALLPLDEARGLRLGQLAEITVPGQPEPWPGQVETIDFRLRPPRPGEPRQPDTSPRVPVVIRPDRPLNFDNLGFPVSVRFL